MSFISVFCDYDLLITPNDFLLLDMEFFFSNFLMFEPMPSRASFIIFEGPADRILPNFAVFISPSESSDLKSLSESYFIPTFNVKPLWLLSSIHFFYFSPGWSKFWIWIYFYLWCRCSWVALLMTCFFSIKRFGFLYFLSKTSLPL